MPLTDADRTRLLAIEAKLEEHQFPPQLVVENTSYCNMRCVHCSHREMTRAQRHMPRALWNQIVEEVGATAPGTELWPTFYGEALILSRAGELWDRLHYAAAVGCTNLVLNSNGTFLDRWDTIDRILESPLRRFIVSLDGFTTETFEAIRLGGDRDRIYAAVEELLRCRDEQGSSYPVVICQFSLMKQNRHEAAEFRRYWQARGAEVKVRPMLEWGAVGTVHAATLDHETTFRIACPWSNKTMAILQDGRATACAVDYDAAFSVGNVANATVAELWQRLGERLRRPHSEHRWNELPEICRRCRDWQVAGAEYEKEKVPGTRPFWFAPGS
jgi:radical SAM protein with 4Fe4S-binding SPASM domain